MEFLNYILTAGEPLNCCYVQSVLDCNRPACSQAARVLGRFIVRLAIGVFSGVFSGGTSRRPKGRAPWLQWMGALPFGRFIVRFSMAIGVFVLAAGPARAGEEALLKVGDHSVRILA